MTRTLPPKTTMSDPLPLRTEFLFRMTLGVGAPQHTGPSTGVERRVVPVTSGTFEGPSIKGELVPGTAGDWIRIEPDGTSHLDVRMVLKTDKGATLYVSYTGVRAGDKEVLARVGSTRDSFHTLVHSINSTKRSPKEPQTRRNTTSARTSALKPRTRNWTG